MLGLSQYVYIYIYVYIHIYVYIYIYIGQPAYFIILKIVCCETLLTIPASSIVKPKILYPTDTAVVLKQHPVLILFPYSYGTNPKKIMNNIMSAHTLVRKALYYF